MASESTARKGSFSVAISDAACPRPSRVVLARDIATTFAEKNRLLEEVLACLRAGLVTDEREVFRVRLSIDEGVQNAFSHGNKEDPGKRIRLQVFEDDESWGVIVTDEGEGFGHDSVSDPRTPEGRWREHGRGLMIMWEFMDDVSYFDGGRTLKLLKRKTGRRSLTSA
jgi:anti-sigma regulatory factor (Ser/Thr protein kinase)